MSLINRTTKYKAGDFITPREMAEILCCSAKEFTDAKRRADFGFDFTVIRLKPKSARILFLRSEFNEFLREKLTEAARGV